MDDSAAVRYNQLRIVLHACVVIALGLLAGFVLIYSALSEIALWPLFSRAIEIPGDISLWRGAHTGPIMNALMAIGLAWALPLIKAEPQTAQRIATALIVTMWGNTVFYLARVVGTNRGLALRSELYGAGNLGDAIAMVGACVAIASAACALWWVFRSARRALLAATE
jgi:hypothetical protein